MIIILELKHVSRWGYNLKYITSPQFWHLQFISSPKYLLKECIDDIHKDIVNTHLRLSLLPENLLLSPPSFTKIIRNK